MEYLTVREVALLVRRNEETIRRMIRARKLDVTLDNNNRKQGYMIPVEQLTDTWDISPEEVRRFIAERDARQEAETAGHKLPLGPGRDFDAAGMGAEIGRNVARTLSGSVQRIAQEMDRMAARYRADDDGGNSNMSSDMNDRQPDDRDDSTLFEMDFSAAGARVGEILGEAYVQIRRAVDQVSKAYTEARAQHDRDHTPDAGETARRVQQERESIIRDSIARAAASRPTEPPCAPDECDGGQEERAAEPGARGECCDAQPAPGLNIFPEYGDRPEPEFDPRTVADESSNTSYQMLQAARRAVEESMHGAPADGAEPDAGQTRISGDAARWHAAVEDDIARLAQQQAAMQEPAPAAAPDPVQLPDDRDAMQQRIDGLESQLSRMSAQLELLTRRLLGEDK